MDSAMWWRTTIYIIILGSVCGDETVSADPKEATSPSNHGLSSSEASYISPTVLATSFARHATPPTIYTATAESQGPESNASRALTSMSTIGVLPTRSVTTMEKNTSVPLSSVPIAPSNTNSGMKTSVTLYPSESSVTQTPIETSLRFPVTTLYPSESSVLASANPTSQYDVESSEAASSAHVSLSTNSNPSPSTFSSQVTNNLTSHPTESLGIVSALSSLRMVTDSAGSSLGRVTGSAVSSLPAPSWTTTETEHVVSTYGLSETTYYTEIQTGTNTDSVMSLQPNTTVRPSETSSVSPQQNTQGKSLTPTSSALSYISLPDSSVNTSFTGTLESSSTEMKTNFKSSSVLQSSIRLLSSSRILSSALPNIRISTDLISNTPTKTPIASPSPLTTLQASPPATSYRISINTTPLLDVAPSTPSFSSSGLETSFSILVAELSTLHSISSSIISPSSASSQDFSSPTTHPTDSNTPTISKSSTRISIPPTPLPSSFPSESITRELSRHSMPSTVSATPADVTSHVTPSSVIRSVSTTTPPPATTNQTRPVNEAVVNHTFEMVFEGLCGPLVNDKNVLKAFWEQLREKIVQKLKVKANLIKAGDIYCNPIRISFTYFFVPQENLKSIAKLLESFLSDIHINVTIPGHAEHYRAVKLNLAPTGRGDKEGSEETAGLEQTDLIVLIAAGSFCLVLIIAGLVICIREFYHRKRTRIFELANKYQVEDFTLTKIPRPAVTYTEKGVDINTNGHGDPHDLEKETLMDNLQLRVNSNENGLVIGITGTQERPKPVSTPSPSTSLPESEHLQLPLVSKEEEPLQSQDNPIYYIDDDQSD